MKDKLGEKITTEFIGLRSKTNSCVIDDCSENKNAKGTKRCVIKRNLKFEDYKNCLEAIPLENKTNHLKKNETDADSLKEDHKEFIKKQ